MDQPRILRIYLHPPVLKTARAGKLGFLSRLQRLLQHRSWQVLVRRSGEEARRVAPHLPGYALFHMERPTHARALTFRRAYHYPFWRLERQAERWRWPVAEAGFDPAGVDAQAAAEFARRLRARVLPGPVPVPVVSDDEPAAMVEAVARTGRPAVATLHPKERYDPADHRALHDLAACHPNLRLGGATEAQLRGCRFVATQNSAVAFDGLILGKPAVLFGMADFHHAALNVAELGPDEALARAWDQRPEIPPYLEWFLRRTSLDMMAPDADARLLAAMEKGGWPV